MCWNSTISAIQYNDPNTEMEMSFWQNLTKSLPALEVVKMAISSAASDVNFVKMRTYQFQLTHPCLTFIWVYRVTKIPSHWPRWSSCMYRDPPCQHGYIISQELWSPLAQLYQTSWITTRDGLWPWPWFMTLTLIYNHGQQYMALVHDSAP